MSQTTEFLPGDIVLVSLTKDHWVEAKVRSRSADAVSVRLLEPVMLVKQQVIITKHIFSKSTIMENSKSSYIENVTVASSMVRYKR